MSDTISRPTLAARLEGLAGVLSGALAQWAARDDTRPQPGIREAANTAVDAIDAMLRELHQARGRLLDEIRDSDDVANARAEALLARLRHERPGGRP